MSASFRLAPLGALAGLGLALAGPAVAQDGRALFAANCSACHQAEGQGVPGAFPALAGNVFVQGAPEAVASTVLNGRGGMPSFKGDLTDAEVAAILSFVRQSWGNKAGPVMGSQVASARTPARADAPGAALQAH